MQIRDTFRWFLLVLVLALATPLGAVFSPNPPKAPRDATVTAVNKLVATGPCVEPFDRRKSPTRARHAPRRPPGLPQQERAGFGAESLAKLPAGLTRMLCPPPGYGRNRLGSPIRLYISKYRRVVPVGP